MRVIFVCTGNTCRSPMAEGYLRDTIEKKNLKNIETISRGLLATNGHPPTDKAIQAIREMGIDISAHRAKQFDPGETAHGDLILTMGNDHLNVVRFEAPTVASFTLPEYAGELGEVSDPYGREQFEYDRAARRIAALIDKVLKRIS